MAQKKAIKVKEINLDALIQAPITEVREMCTVGKLIADLPEPHASAFAAHIGNPNIGITTIQTMILKAGLAGRGWNSLKNHRDGICLCEKAGN